MKYYFIETCSPNGDGTWSSPDFFGNELIRHTDGRQELKLGGYKNPLNLLFADPDGIEYIVLREANKYHEGVNLNKDSIVIDIGAHVGVVSMTIAKLYGCRVEAYEPANKNYTRLVENIRINNLEGLVIPHNLAVTSSGGMVEVGGPDDNSGGFTIYRSIYKNSVFIPVDSVTLADIVDGREIDLLKIDCEGAEHEIFLDLEPLKHIKAIRGEFHTMLREDDLVIEPKPLLERIRKVVPDTKVEV